MTEEEILGKDLKVTVEMRTDYTRPGADLVTGNRGDLDIVAGRENLGQAIILRLLARRGELAELGHPDYGSRLHELIGEPNYARTRELVRLYVKECVAQEPRVGEIVDVSVTTHATNPNAVSVNIIVRPIRDSVPVSIVFPYLLEANA